MKLSVVITSHNNQDLIADCIDSVRFADEIIVVDNQSTDSTAELATRLGARVLAHENNPTKLNESKNFGFTKATHDWILNLDSDERVEPDLAKEIAKVVGESNLDFDGYLMPRHNVIFGKVIRHGLWYPDKQLRLFRRGKGKFPNIHNHELLEVKGEVGELSGHILHYNYSAVSQYIQKIDRQYSDNEAETFLASGKKISWHDAIGFPASDFMANYFARQGYKDGLHGLVLSMLQAFYMFIVFCKIWEKQGFKQQSVTKNQVKQQLNIVYSQVTYWHLLGDLSTLSLSQKLLRKLKYHWANFLLRTNR